MKLYTDDILECNQFAQANAENLTRCILFVLATIQQQLETVPVIMTDFETNGPDSRFGWGSKKHGLAFLNLNANSLFASAVSCRENPADLMALFLRIPGLGLVKAGFLCQLFAGSVGCIDSHNLKMYDIPLSAMRYDNKAKPETKERKIETYISLCEGLGGSAVLWSSWCDYVAKLRPYNWENGAEVSKFHIEVLSGIESGGITDLFSDIEYNAAYLAA